MRFLAALLLVVACAKPAVLPVDAGDDEDGVDRAADSRFSAQIPGDVRSFVLPIPCDGSAVKQIGVGDRIDVIVTLPLADGGFATMTPLENVYVLAATLGTEHDFLSVLVSAEDAEILAHSLARGVLRVALRNHLDKTLFLDHADAGRSVSDRTVIEHRQQRPEEHWQYDSIIHGSPSSRAPQP